MLAAFTIGVAALCALAPGAAWAQDDPGKTTPPSITGAPVIGQTLRVVPGTTERRSPNTTVYEWRRCVPGTGTCRLVGAGERYTVSLRDAGQAFVVSQVITWPNKKQTVLRSAPTSPVRAPRPPAPTPTPAPTPAPTPNPPAPPTAPSLTGAPEIVGAAQGGQTLVADPGAWSSTLPMTLSYQWRRCDAGGGSCSGIDGASSRTYTVGAADVGSKLDVVVTARSAAGAASGASAPTPVVVQAAGAQGSFDQTPTGGDNTGSGTDGGGGGQPGATPQPNAPGSPARPATPRRLAPVVVRFAGSFNRRQTVFKLVSVRVPARATLQVRCAGRGCAKRARKARLRSGVTRLRWLERRYRPGTSIELRVSRSGRIGTYTRVVIRRGAAPKRRDACLRPSATRPTACPGR